MANPPPEYRWHHGEGSTRLDVFEGDAGLEFIGHIPTRIDCDRIVHEHNTWPGMLDALKLVREGQACICDCETCGQDKDYHVELALNAHDYKPPDPCLADIVNEAITKAEEGA